MKALQETYDSNTRTTRATPARSRRLRQPDRRSPLGQRQEPRDGASSTAAGASIPIRRSSTRCRAPGTDIDVIRRVLRDKTPDQIKEIEKRVGRRSSRTARRSATGSWTRSAAATRSTSASCSKARRRRPRKSSPSRKRKQQYEKTAYAPRRSLQHGRTRAARRRGGASSRRSVRSRCAPQGGSEEAAYYQLGVDQGEPRRRFRGRGAPPVGRLHHRPAGDDRRDRRGAARHRADVRGGRADRRRRRSARSPRPRPPSSRSWRSRALPTRTRSSWSTSSAAPSMSSSRCSPRGSATR